MSLTEVLVVFGCNRKLVINSYDSCLSVTNCHLFQSISIKYTLPNVEISGLLYMKKWHLDTEKESTLLSHNHIYSLMKASCFNRYTVSQMLPLATFLLDRTILTLLGMDHLIIGGRV